MDFSNLKYYALALIGSCIPRNKDIWITGKIEGWEYENIPPKFFDNSKYFYLYLVNHTTAKVYWISESEDEIRLLKELGLPVVDYNSFLGKWLVVRAKYSFHHYGYEQINRILQYGMTQINFWHGTPLKKIGYDVVGEPREEKSKLAKFFDREGKYFFSSTSQYLSETILKSAFGLNSHQMLNFGYPRTDILRLNREEAIDFINKYAKNLEEYIYLIQSKKVFLYMPTYRDDDIDYFKKANIDYDRLDILLAENNSVFLVKLHPLTRDTNLKGYKNIIQIKNDVDIYPLLIFVDYLITDYSSIFFDFLPLDREMIFIPYDYDKYISTRELYFDYKDFVPGVIYDSFDEFLAKFNELGGLDYHQKRNEISNLFITDYNFDACEKVYKFIKELDA